MRWLALAAFAATSVAMVITIVHLRALMTKDVGPRTRRLRIYRMGLVVGFWEIAVGLCIATIPPGGMWVNAIGPLALGVMFLVGARLARKFQSSPWWESE